MQIISCKGCKVHYPKPSLTKEGLCFNCHPVVEINNSVKVQNL